jgi:hypothetical protein
LLPGHAVVVPAASDDDDDDDDGSVGQPPYAMMTPMWIQLRFAADAAVATVVRKKDCIVDEN